MKLTSRISRLPLVPSRSVGSIFAAFWLTLAVMAVPAQAQTATVTIFGDVVAVDGDCSLREAWTNSAECGIPPFDEIVLSAGTYDLNALLGDTNAPQVLLRGAGATSTTIDILHSGSRNFTIQVGNALGLEDLTLQGGSAAGGGGQIATNMGTVEANRVIFRNGAAPGSAGGCINIDVSSFMRVYNSVFENCSAVTGGAVYSANSTVEIINSTFVSNSGAGAAVHHQSGTVTLTNVIIWNGTGTALTGTPVLASTNSDESVDPIFTTEFTDLTLRSTSPFINLGELIGAGPSSTFSLNYASTDIAGNARTIDVLDRGAYERTVSRDAGDAPDVLGSYPTLLENGGPAHVLPANVYLGAVSPDAEDNGVPDADAGSDGIGGDDDTTDDEDGVTFSPMVSDAGVPTTGFYTVQTSGSGRLNGWVDVPGDGSFDPADNVFPDDATGTAAILKTLSIPASHPLGNYFARMRFCSAAADCDLPTSVALDGEVEDHSFEVVAAAGANIVLDLPEGAGLTGPYKLALVAGSVVLTDESGAPVVLFSAPGIASLDLSLTSADEVLTIDYSGGDLGIPITINSEGGGDHLIFELNGLTPAETVTFDGGADADLVTIQSMAAAVYDLYSEHFDEPSGEIFVNAVKLLDYDNVEPIIVTLTLADAEFQFNNDPTSTIELNDGAFALDMMSFIDCVSCGESVSFTNPTDNLIVHAGGGEDTINFTLLDAAGPVPANILIEGEAGNDLFNITPSATYAMVIDGGAPPTCDGDVLDLMGGPFAGQALSMVAPGVGNWSFDAPIKNVNFAGIEIRADAVTDVSVTAAWDKSSGYPADEREITFTLTNNGVDEVTCVDAVISLPAILNVFAPYPVEFYPVFASGSFGAGIWNVDRLLSGATATITFRGVIDALMPAVFTSTIDASAGVPSDDPDLTNNIASDDFTVLNFFRFPAKAVAISAQYVELPSGLDRVVAGLFQGAPGFNTPLLCRIPDADGVLFTQPGVGNHWKPCGDGLPVPLHVTDLFLDDRGTPGNVLDDRLWLASWGSAGLYYSDDYAETFTAMEPVLGPKGGWANVYSITKDAGQVLYISANNGLVFRSFNEGESWQQVSSLPGASADTPWSMQAHPSEGGVVYAGTFGRGVFVSRDFGFTWEPLGGDVINDDLLNPDNSGNDFAGHVFDMAFSPDHGNAAAPNPDEYIFIGTGKGVWRLLLDAAGVPVGTWEQMDITVTLDSGSVVTPEIRVLAFDEDAADADDDLLVGSWGFGAFKHEDPIGMGGVAFSQMALRQGQVSMILIEPDGDVFVGSSEFGVQTLSPEASATDTEPDAQTSVPEGYALSQNYPNPFNPVTTIGFELPATGHVRLAVYDVLGREMEVLASGTLEAGSHQVRFDAQALPSGTYIYRLYTDKGSFTRQLVLMK